MMLPSLPEQVLSAVAAFDAQARPANGPIQVVDLFCGCGGLSCGFEAVGRLLPSYRLTAAVDIDQEAMSTYACNLPIQPLRLNLAEIPESSARLASFASELGIRPGDPLVLVGGPPCQGFSAHRKKEGKPDDPRNDLVRAYARIATALRPDFVLMENVPEVLARKHWKQFEGFRTILEQAGYRVRPEIHNLAAFGVPQERFRALVVASRVPVGMPAGFLEPGAFRTVRDAIGWLPPVQPGEVCPEDAMHFCTRHRQSTLATIRQVPRDGGRRPAGVGPACLDRVDGFRDVYGRMYWDHPANTITAYARNPASGRYVHPEQDRGLTIREAALLQGFPRGYRFEGSFDHKFIQIGNAVPPVFAACLALHFLEQLQRPSGSDEKSAADVEPMSDSFSSGIAGRKKGRPRACPRDLQ